ncbi:MAG: hypothetical protein HUK03_06055 [Bacteroidaceae bacterium]|nr:hypothetical protein [Bacteroidaceae bacterium]
MKTKNAFYTRFICGMMLVAVGMTFTSCRENEEPITPKKETNTSFLDGLWVEQVKGGDSIVPHIAIRGNEVVLCRSNPFECDYSNRVSGALLYDDATRKGSMKFSDGTNISFLCDERGTLCSPDSIPYYKIDNTLDNLQQANVKPALALCKDYIGPDHDLGIDLSSKPLLQSSNLTAGGAWYVDLLKFAGESVAKGALSWVGGQAMQAIFDCFYTDPTSEKLESILAQVGEINAKLSEIEQLIRMQGYEEYINQRTNDYCNPLSNYSKRYADAMMLVDKNDSAAIADIVNHWHDDLPVISGRLGGPMEAASNYMDFLMTSRVEQTNIYAIYDIYTFNCVPWAHQGYDFRQSLRACDLSLITTNVYMAILYAKIHNWAEVPAYRSYVDDLNKKVQTFMKFCEENPVEISDKLVCQIKDAHFVMEKEMIVRDYNLPNGMTWYWPGCQFVHGDNQTSDLIYYGGMNMSVEQFRQKQIRPEELRAICKYYDPSLTLKKVFQQSGATCTEDLLILCGGTSSDYDGNLYLNLAHLYQPGDDRLPQYTDWLLAKTHWSITFRYWFDGWDTHPGYYWVKAVATDVLYRY